MSTSRYWTDHLGRTWKIPTSKGRLKCGTYEGHAALRAFIIDRDGHRCQWCGAEAIEPGECPMTANGSRLVADHIVPRCRGGSHHPDNLQALCERCNSAKGATTYRRGA